MFEIDTNGPLKIAKTKVRSNQQTTTVMVTGLDGIADLAFGGGRWTLITGSENPTSPQAESEPITNTQIENVDLCPVCEPVYIYPKSKRRFLK